MARQKGRETERALARMEAANKQMDLLNALFRLNHQRQEKLMREAERFTEEYQKAQKEWWDAWETATGLTKPPPPPPNGEPFKTGP